MRAQQLGSLRKAALVKTRREAKHVFYRLDRDRMRDVSTLIDRFAGTVAVAGDRNVDQRRQRGGSAAMFAKIGSRESGGSLAFVHALDDADPLFDQRLTEMRRDPCDYVEKLAGLAVAHIGDRRFL